MERIGLTIKLRLLNPGFYPRGGGVVDAANTIKSGAPVDPHSADQIVLPLALADGPSEFLVSTVTRHHHTNIAVIRTFLDREITCDGDEGATGVVRVAAPAL